MRATLATLGIAVDLLLAAAAVAAPVNVRAIASELYIHGVDAEMSEALLGPGAVPALHELLADPEFPRRDNVVAFLAWLGTPDTTPALERYLGRAASLATPEERRALLLSAEALGRIASRGDEPALDALLALVDPGRPLPAAVRAAPAPIREALVEQAVRALGIAGAPRARKRLQGLIDDPGSRPEGGDYAALAGRALEWPEEERAVSPADTGETSPQDGHSLQEDGGVAHEFGVDFVNHAALGSPLNNAAATTLAAQATIVVGRADSLGDTACCLRVRNNGDRGRFGSVSDGLSVIDTATELSQVLAVSSARVKVVELIQYCAVPGTNVIGCAPVPGRSFIVVRLGSRLAEGILWLHEYGHNVGLSHNANSKNVMHASASTGAIELTASQCAAYHSPPASTRAVLEEIGICDDADLDNVASGADNCPAAVNTSQAETDGDGVGNVCDNCVLVPNPDQADLDGNGEGDLCDADDDGDGVADGPDCRPVDGTVWAAPAAAVEIQAGDPTGLFSWTAPADPGSSAPGYDVLRAENPADLGAAEALACGQSETGLTDPEIPTTLFFYLVRTVNLCGSALGPGSPGFARAFPGCA